MRPLRAPRRVVIAVAAICAVVFGASANATQEAPAAPTSRAVPPLAIRSAPPSLTEIDAGLARAIAWLRPAQKPCGAWGGAGNTLAHEVWPNVEAHRSWQVATTGLVVETLLRHGGAEDAECRAQVERAVDWMVANHDLRRCDDWDIDNVWGFVYGLEALAVAKVHPWFADSPRRPAIDAAIAKLLVRIAAYQSPNGGFGYYANAIDAWRPQWATSFTTAAMVLAIEKARAAGATFPPEPLAAMRRAVARSRLPSGAFTYDVMALPAPDSVDGINDPRGSLGRIAVCDLALLNSRSAPSAATLARGVDLFFRHHAYLDIARMRPMPHEAFHFNSGYFYCFGHHYLGELLPQLPPALKRDAAGKLAFEVLKTQERDGACWDYYFADHSKAYATAFSAMALGSARRALSVAGD
ncbi:MAG: hypothetical protein EXS13_02850 [Planctomycetes bacterium]|nr:hypothetical protein [Planctomycetota bacterium]